MTGSVGTAAIRAAPTPELEVGTLYGILRLRSEVFVVEQDCVFLDLDGLDLVEGAVQLWVEEEGVVVAAARLIPGPATGCTLGRIVVAAAARGRGLGAALTMRALEMAPRPVHIRAQSRLCAWYERLGFVASGDEYLDDGILHTPMLMDRPHPPRTGSRPLSG